MRTARTLLVIGGIANALFFLFHVFLGWRLHQWAQLPPDVRALLEMLNGGGTVFILLLTLASLVWREDALSTGLGSAVLTCAATLYLLRAAAEVVIAPRMNPAILATCVLTGGIYLSVTLLATRMRQPAR